VPAGDLVALLSEEMAALTPPHQALPKINKSIRRINRDVRFSKNKMPHDSKLHLVFWTGDHPTRSPAIHIVIHPDHVGLGAGHWAMSADELDRYRTAVCTPSGDDLTSIVSTCAEAGFDLAEESLKRVPNGFGIAAERETLLKRKGLVILTRNATWGHADLLDADRRANALPRLAAVNEWLIRHVTG
jgi:uncharacterized protein (TIGR02453 family)